MTYFATMVIGDNPEGQMAPYHEYESTGINDQYVKDIDITDLTLEEYEQEKIIQEKDFSFLYFLTNFSRHPFLKNISDIDIYNEHSYGYYTIIDDNIKVFKRTNPFSKWDHFSLGDGYFRLKPKENNSLSSSHALKSEIDFEFMMNQERIRASNEYDLYHEIVNTHSKPKTLEEFKRQYQKTNSYAEIRSMYKRQDAMIALSRFDKFKYHIGCIVSRYNQPKDEFVEYEALKTIATEGLVKDSVWYANREKAWFTDSPSVSDYVWLKETWKLIQSLPDDTLITIYECHS